FIRQPPQLPDLLQACLVGPEVLNDPLERPRANHFRCRRRHQHRPRPLRDLPRLPLTRLGTERTGKDAERQAGRSAQVGELRQEAISDLGPVPFHTGRISDFFRHSSLDLSHLFRPVAMSYVAFWTRAWRSARFWSWPMMSRSCACSPSTIRP